MKSDHVLIVGAGGLGVPAITALARAGVRDLTIMDADPIELSNLPRQVLYHTEDIGTPKVLAAKRRLAELYPEIRIEACDYELDASNAAGIIARHGFVIDATDNPAIKFLINDTCLKLNREYVYGGVIGFTGQAMTVMPGRTACLRCIFEEPPDEAEVATCRDAGIVGPVAGAIGELQAAEALRWLRGETPALAGAMLTYDGAATAKVRLTMIAPRPGCRCEAASRAHIADSPASSTS